MVNIKTTTGHENVAMLGIGAYRPKRVVTNAEVCETLDSTPEWIEKNTGIKSRRWFSGDETLRSIAATAGARALKNSGIAPEKIDAVILCTSSWLTFVPNGAPSVAYDIGINGVPAFDLTAGCGGFGYGLAVASGMIRGGTAEYVLLIGAETMTVGINPRDRGTAMIFGDGGGAVVLGPSEVNGVSPAVWGSDGENASAITQNYDFLNYQFVAADYQHKDAETDPMPRMSMIMEGPKVFRWAAITLPRALAEAIENSGVAKEDIEVFIPHQANSRINELMKQNLGLPEDLPMANDIETTGNTSAASIPLAMEEMLRTGKAKGGQVALLLGFGAGLSYSGQVVVLPPAPPAEED